MSLATRGADVRSAASACETVIDAERSAPLVDWREWWRFRELLLLLVWRDIRLRYRQTALGVAWALAEPLAGAAVYTVLFNRLVGVQSGATPYVLHCLCGLLVWTFFARALRAVSVSLVANASLATKAYFPRIVLPLSAIGVAVVDFVVSLAALLLAMLALGYPLTPTAAFALLAPLYVGLVALGAGGVLAAVNVRYRDVTQALPLLLQIGLFTAPIVYPIDRIPEQWIGLYALNPMVGGVELFRAALLDTPVNLLLALPGASVALLLLVAGLRALRACDRTFADIV